MTEHNNKYRNKKTQQQITEHIGKSKKYSDIY